MRRLLLFVILFLPVQLLFADGGRLRLHEAAGPFVVTLFTTPDPLSQGQADFSVAVERAQTQGLVQDADVTLTLAPADGKGDRMVLAMSHDAATSRFLQAANFTLPRSGVWDVVVEVRQGGESGRCSGQVEVLPPQLLTDQIAWEVAAVPIALAFFGIHQWRKRRYKRWHRAARQSV